MTMATRLLLYLLLLQHPTYLADGAADGAADDEYPSEWYVTDEAGLGACYDMTVHKCGCAADECNRKACHSKGLGLFFWSKQCSISCDPITCPADDDNSGVSMIDGNFNTVFGSITDVISMVCLVVAPFVPPVQAFCPEFTEMPPTNDYDDNVFSWEEDDDDEDLFSWEEDDDEAEDETNDTEGGGEEEEESETTVNEEEETTVNEEEETTVNEEEETTVNEEEETTTNEEEETTANEEDVGITNTTVTDTPGGCYDKDIQECSCDANACSQELCEILDRVWKDSCPTYCDPAKCASGEGGILNGEDGNGNGNGDGNEDEPTNISGGEDEGQEGDGGEESGFTPNTDDTYTILATVEALGYFNSLLAAIEKVEMKSFLELPGPYTVFAPTDLAFLTADDSVNNVLSNGDKQAITELLMNHIIQSPIPLQSYDLQFIEAVTTAGQATIDIQVKPDGMIMLHNEAYVITADVQASNGIIHVVDKVMMLEDDEDGNVNEESVDKEASSTGISDISSNGNPSSMIEEDERSVAFTLSQGLSSLRASTFAFLALLLL